jgi:hypothetical protein
VSQQSCVDFDDEQKDDSDDFTQRLYRMDRYTLVAKFLLQFGNSGIPELPIGDQLK